MRKWMTLYFLVLLLVAFVPPATAAETQPPAAATEPVPIPAGRPGDPGFSPIEKRADDSGMATVTVIVFGAPVGIWLIARTIKRSRKK